MKKPKVGDMRIEEDGVYIFLNTSDEWVQDRTPLYCDYDEEDGRGHIDFECNPCEFERIVEKIQLNVSSESCKGCKYCSEGGK